MLPVLEMASVHNVELVKFFFKLLYKADTRRNMQDVPKGKYYYCNKYFNFIQIRGMMIILTLITVMEVEL